jgi:ABC-type dipeptide/oligopeptide/nickel transport system permease subunit
VSDPRSSQKSGRLAPQQETPQSGGGAGLVDEPQTAGSSAWKPHSNREATSKKSVSPTRLAFRRLFANKLAVAGLATVTFLCLAAIFGPMVWKYSHQDQIQLDWEAITLLPPAEQQKAMFPWGPSWKHPMGVDAVGHDVLAQTLMGARVSLAVGFMASFIAVAIGIIYGGVAGYVGGRTGRVMMRAVDIIYAVPLLLIVIFLIIVFEGSPVEKATLEFDVSQIKDRGDLLLPGPDGEPAAAVQFQMVPGVDWAFDIQIAPERLARMPRRIENRSATAGVSVALSPKRIDDAAALAFSFKKRPERGSVSLEETGPFSVRVIYDPPAPSADSAPEPERFAIAFEKPSGGFAAALGWLLRALKAWIEYDSDTRRMKIIFIAMGITYWLPMARVVRAKVLALKEMDFALAARASGASHSRILFRHLLPNSLGPIIVLLTLSIPEAIFAEAFLSYIGLGVEVPLTSWGTLASDGVKHIRSEGGLHLLIFPALAISITMLAFNFLGDGLRDAFDPQMKNA